MHYLIGIDDTDNLDSRGTGFRARQLGERIVHESMAELQGITRHQLLVSPEIPYTSHNSSACLSIMMNAADMQALVDLCRGFLLKESAEGSDAGLCIAASDRIDGALLEYGRRAKREVLTMAMASAAARERGIVLEGLTGTGGGIIGALAGVSLRKSGNDGRFLWLRGMRELSGIYTAAELQRCVDIDMLCDIEYNPVPGTDLVDTGTWFRPILKNGKSVVLLEEADNGTAWRLLSKDTIKQLSN